MGFTQATTLGYRRSAVKIPPVNTALFFAAIAAAGVLPSLTAWADDRLDGPWVGTEKIVLVTRTDCPKANYPMTLPARIIVAGSVFAVVDGYGPGRYTNVQKSFGTLVFEVPNTRRGVLTISADGNTLTEKGFIRRTTTVTSNQRGGAFSGQAPQIAGKTACLDEITGVFHREKQR